MSEASPPGTALIHGTAIVIGEKAVLILGASGTGKSDLALRLIDRGAILVADDGVIVEAEGERVMVRAPERIAGRMEVRGVGLVATPHRARAPLALCVELGPEAERLPERRTRLVAGIAVPVVAIDPRSASAPVKVEWALRHSMGENDW
jgi:serine kinase of HPr protein (carbohydrate metabolism regulator)